MFDQLSWAGYELFLTYLSITILLFYLIASLVIQFLRLLNWLVNGRTASYVVQKHQELTQALCEDVQSCQAATASSEEPAVLYDVELVSVK